MADILEAIIARTLADPAMTALVSGRVRPGHPSQGDGYPLVLLRVISHLRGHHLTAADGIAEDRIQFDAMGETATQVTAIARALETLWDGYSGTVAGVVILWAAQLDEVDLDEPSEPGTDRFTRRKAIDFRFKYRVPIPSFA